MGARTALDTLIGQAVQATDTASGEIAHAEKSGRTALDRLSRRIDRATKALPTPSGLFLHDGDRAVAYRVAVSLLSDMERLSQELQGALDALMAARRRLDRAARTLLAAEQALDAADRAGISLPAPWRTVQALFRSQDDATARLGEQIGQLTLLLTEILLKFGRQVSKNADFAAKGENARPQELRGLFEALGGLVTKAVTDFQNG